MTVRAGEFYPNEARGLGVVVPPIFDGELKPLMDAGQVMPTVAPGPVGIQVSARFKTFLESAVPYIKAGSDAAPFYYDRTVTASSDRNIAAITGRMLLSTGVRGGRISELAIEAIAPEELVLPGMLAAFGPVTNSKGIRGADRRVFMIVSGMLEEGRFASIPCAGIAGVYLNTTNHTKKATPHFVTGALSRAVAKDWYDDHR